MVVFTSMLLLLFLHQNGGHGHDLDEKGGPGPGHLKPLGSQRPPEGTIESVEEFPDPKEFYKNYVLPGTPLLIKNGAKDIPAYTLWNDAYLMEKFGKEYIDIEIGKKEKRQGAGKAIRLQTFLKMYNESDVYMVQDATEPMMPDLVLPRSLQCGGFQKQMLQAVLWFSSGGTKSVLHNDQPDNLNCIMDGSKEIVFIDKVYEDDVQADGWVFDGGYSRVDVESVDLNIFPRFKSVPWWSATMEKGDCLFIPYKWFHAVKSSESRNLAANLWFSHLLWFNQSDCDKNPAKKEHVSLDKVTMAGLESIEGLRVELFRDLEGQEEISVEDASKAWTKYLNIEDVQQVFGLADINHDMVLTWEEVYRMDVLEIARLYPEFANVDDEEALEGVSHDEL